MSHWISSIIKHCCLLHSKGRLPAPISPCEILLLSSNNLFHPKVVNFFFERVISLCSQYTGYSFHFLYFCRLHKLTLDDFKYDSFMHSYIKCVYIIINYIAPHIHCLMVPGFAIPLDVIDVILENRKDNKNQFVTVSLYGTEVSFTPNLCCDIWCKEQDRVSLLSCLSVLWSWAASCA